ncbi:M48 family metallopeptidase [Myxosarcina sp. GI1]|uniref:M48 family metallopeptidase n=1 Tax=Myxosarcina sp. GI1 TaxID=1541065 RepID=UPI0006913E2A|nr:M48 family metallopeptidase [Myxosarcina sp. GI1]
MKSLNLFLVILSIVSAPGTALAQGGLQNLDLPATRTEKVETENSAREENEEVNNNDSGGKPIETPETSKEQTSEVTTSDKPSPEEIARLEKLAAADKLYLQGNKAEAATLYREAKEPWEQEIKHNDEILEAIYDPAKLSPGGKVYWRNYQQGKKQQLESKIFSSLELLIAQQPEFIPGYTEYAKVLTQYDREPEALQILEQATNLYPSDSKLLKAKMQADVAAEKWLEASIAARQFALFNPNSPKAEEFTQLADKYLEEYKSELRSDMTWNAVGNVIAGAAGFALTGNLFGPISAIETTVLMLRGESAVGEGFAKQVQKQIPMLENEEVLNYVRKVGSNIAEVAGRDDFEYEFYVIMDDRLNAFALPGGKVFVNAGAIMNTDTEAELAGLLAHEVSHAALSHGFQLVTKGNFTANVVQYVPYVGSTATNLIVLDYSRGMERQADIFGTRILVAAGYAADGVRNLMAKLDEINKAEDNPHPPAWLSTHPDSEDRISYMENLIVDRNLNRYAYEGVTKHQEMKAKVTSLWQEFLQEKCSDKKERGVTVDEEKCKGIKIKEEVDNDEKETEE